MSGLAIFPLIVVTPDSSVCLYKNRPNNAPLYSVSRHLQQEPFIFGNQSVLEESESLMCPDTHKTLYGQDF